MPNDTKTQAHRFPLTFPNAARGICITARWESNSSSKNNAGHMCQSISTSSFTSRNFCGSDNGNIVYTPCYIAIGN